MKPKGDYLYETSVKYYCVNTIDGAHLFIECTGRIGG